MFMDKINQLVALIGKDKWVHFVVSVLIFVPVSFVSGPIMGVIAGTMLNGIKQVYDVKTGANTPQEAGWDMLAGIAGSLTAWLCFVSSLKPLFLIF